MGQAFKWLFRIASGMVFVTVLIVVVLYFLLARSLPIYDKEMAVNGISAPVEIVRDNANVPHVFGKTDADTFFGLGYVHAQDRLWQMVMLRRTAQGRLSEIFGTRTVEIDKLMRRLDLYRHARDSVDVQDARTRAALKAYAAGVNARLSEINEEARGKGAPEMFIFNPALSPWQPADSIAIVKLLSVQLSGHLQEEVLHARTSVLVNDERLRDIMPLAPGEAITDLPDYAELFPGVDVRNYASNEAAHPLSPIARRGFAGASNVFAAAPKRSATGGTLLANDPHLEFTAPGIWYLARIELATGGVIGGTVPGAPLVMVGRSATLGWGLTSSYMDDQDLYIERLNPENPDQYLTADGFKDFRTESTIIRIADMDPITLTLRWAENGPVLPGTHYNLSEVTPPGHVASLAWTALSGNDTTMTAAMALMRSQSVAEGLRAGRFFVAPTQNLMLVDETSLAMKTIGAMPARHPDHETKGRMPSRGWIAENKWSAMIPYSQNPEFISPEGGILGNMNNKMVDREFPNHVSYLWGDTQRIKRWERLMQIRRVHTRDSFIEAQLDTVSYTARSLLPLIGADLWFTEEAAPEGTPERQRQRALDLLSRWNGEMNEHLPEPLIYAAWLRALMDRLIRDELGPLADEFTHPDPVFIERVFRDIEGAAIWCDIRQSTDQETCVDIARLALDDALVWIGDNYGTALESLRWGDLHQTTHDHPVLGQVPLLRYFVNIRQSTSGGDNTLLRGLTSGEGDNPFENVHGAGYRGVYDFADPDSSVFVTSTGQSGHFLSRHYDDMAQLWRRGEYIPMSLDPDLARAAATGITILTPQQAAQ